MATLARRHDCAANDRFHARLAQHVAARMAGLQHPDAIRAAAIALLSDCTWLAEVLAPLIAGLAADPWFAPAIRVQRDARRTALVLADLPALTLSASITAAAPLASAGPPSRFVLPGRQRVTRYLRGGDAQVRRWQRIESDVPVRCSEVAGETLADGMLTMQDGVREARLIVAAARDVVAVTATVKPGADALVREFAVADGRLLRQASADDAASRAELLLMLLRASGRTDAGACFDSVSHDAAPQLRWAAMREWLMLDAHAAHPRLTAMAANDSDAAVRAASRRTLATLAARMATA
ncbi:hypothetical protein [Sphingomonas sp.]|uniref:hypothetical protein n=1 Tax=Sphingomonas sp. TaxID=28214 RepID=UPI00307F4E06